MPLKSSKDSEPSQNSWMQRGQADTQAIDMTNNDHCEQCLTGVSEFREHSSNSRLKGDTSQVIQGNMRTQRTCNGKYRESSCKSPNCIGNNGNNVSVPKLSWFESMSQIVGLTAAWHKDKVEGNPVGANNVSNAKTNIPSIHSEFNFFL